VEYSRWWSQPDERLAVATVSETVEQVQQVVLIANRNKIPLYPISTGKNLGYGGRPRN
jgi:FAD/FMN-containing dehydrogenase